jgi:hypothetical protein
MHAQISNKVNLETSIYDYTILLDDHILIDLSQKDGYYFYKNKSQNNKVLLQYYYTPSKANFSIGFELQEEYLELKNFDSYKVFSINEFEEQIRLFLNKTMVVPNKKLTEWSPWITHYEYYRIKFNNLYVKDENNHIYRVLFYPENEIVD